MKLTINLATRIYVNAGKVRLYTLITVILFSILLFLNGTNIAAKVGEMERIRKDIATVDSRQKATKKAVPEKEYKNLLARINFANGIIEKRAYNWLTLFDRLEVVVPDGLAITSIQPDMKSQTVRLTGVTRNFRNLRTFVENLENSEFFSEVYLLGHGDTAFEDATKGLTFNLTCTVVMK